MRAELLTRYEADSDNFLSNIITVYLHYVLYKIASTTVDNKL